MHRKVVAALGVLALAVAACSSSGRNRPVAKPGQIVTVLRDNGALFGDVVLDRHGTLYVTDYLSSRVVKVPKRGDKSTVVDGSTVFPLAPHGGGASVLLAQHLVRPLGLAVDSAGMLYVANTNRFVIVALTPSGKPIWVAGTSAQPESLPSSSPAPAFAPPNGPAADVKLMLPRSLALDAAGNLYFDSASSVARLDRDHRVTTVAGTGRDGYSGDGGPATQAQITGGPIALDDAGNLYLGDGGRVRRVDTRGIVETIAGTGEEGFSGDDGPARQARFDKIEGIVIDTRGDIFVSGGNRIREITPDGVVRTVAGTGEEGYVGDGGPATQARFNKPSGLAVDDAGNLYIADELNHRVRMVGAAARR